MRLERRIQSLTPHIVSTNQLHRAGLTWRELSASAGTGADAAAGRDGYVRLRRGWYLPAPVWREASRENRHLAAIIAAVRSSPTPRLFSHRSAATLLELPVWSRWMLPPEAAPDRGGSELVVHQSGPGATNGGNGGPTRRYRAVTETDDAHVVAGFTLTTAERTVCDLARTEPFPVALACADAAVRRLVRVGRQIDVSAWNAWRARLVARADRMPRGTGIAAVRAIAALADPRADSPLESISRLRLYQIGLVPEQQVAVPGRGGGTYYLDFLLRDLGIFGECDGKSKYTDPAFRAGKSAEEVVYAEKRRHDWIVATQDLRGVRWGAADVVTSELFRRTLAAQGLLAPGRATRAFGADIARFLDRLP